MDKGNNKAVAAVVALVIGGLVGGVAGYAISDNQKDDDSNSTSVSENKPNSDTKAADLRANLVNIGTEHVQLANIALDAAMDGADYADEAKAALIKNGEDLSAAIGSVYGDDAQKEFQALWNRHLNDFVDYTVGGVKKDKAAQKAALKDLNDYSTDIGTFLNGANPNLPADTVTKAFKEHLDLVISMIDAHLAADYKKEFAQRAKAVDQIAGTESVLAGAIVKQNPDKF